MSYAGHIVAEAAATAHSAMMTTVVTIPMVMVMVVMIGMMPTPIVGPIRIVPVGVVVP